MIHEEPFYQKTHITLRYITKARDILGKEAYITRLNMTDHISIENFCQTTFTITKVKGLFEVYKRNTNKVKMNG